MARTCGIRIGPRRYELVVLDGSVKKHRIVAFQTGEFPQGGEDPLADAASTLKAAVKSSGAPLDSTAIAIDTGLAAFRTIKLPDIDEGKIEQVIKFEVEGELPQWNIDDVVVDFFKQDSASGESNLLVSAVPKAAPPVLWFNHRSGQASTWAMRLKPLVNRKPITMKKIAADHPAAFLNGVNPAPFSRSPPA